MTNPFQRIPAAVRDWIYIVLIVIFLAATAIQSASGNILEAILAFTASVGGVIAKSNVAVSAPDEPIGDPEPIGGDKLNGPQD